MLYDGSKTINLQGNYVSGDCEKTQNVFLYTYDFILKLDYRRTMTLFSQFKWIKPCSLCNPVDIKHKSWSLIIFLSKSLNNRGASRPVVLPEWEVWRDFEWVGGWVGISAGLLIDNLTPHKDSNSLNTNVMQLFPCCHSILCQGSVPVKVSFKPKDPCLWTVFPEITLTTAQGIITHFLSSMRLISLF